MYIQTIQEFMTEYSEDWVDIPETNYSVCWASEQEKDEIYNGRFIFVSKDDDIRKVIGNVSKIYYYGISQAIEQNNYTFATDLLASVVCDDPFFSEKKLDSHTSLIEEVLSNMPYNDEWRLSYHAARGIITVYANTFSDCTELRENVQTPVTTAAAVRMALSSNQNFSEGFSAVQVYKFSGVPSSSFEQKAMDIRNSVSYSPEKFDYIINPLSLPIDN